MASRASSSISRSSSVRLRQKIVDIYDKKGGALEFVVLETSVTNQDDELCATLHTVAVLRN